MRCLVLFAVLLCGVPQILAQNNPAKTQPATATCSFEDENQVTVRYEPGASVPKKPLPQGQLWPPSGSPMYLFTQAELTIGNTTLPVGAYSMYVIPEKNKWTLIINKNVSAGAPYSQQNDLVRVPMELGHLSDPQPFTVAFGRIAPKQCSMRIYYETAGVWAEFDEK
jgi:DUF2911 family protein